MSEAQGRAAEAGGNYVLADAGLIVRHPFVEKYGTQAKEPIEFGAVYYRRSNPPEYDWERDYAVAREDGHTIFRHWFTWNAVHVAPDTFDFESYDRHLELAARHGIKTIVAELITEAPDWLYHKYPHARVELAGGGRHSSGMNDSNGTGITRMCLDNPEVAAEAEKFLRALAGHYRDNPGLYGYDIWNECSLYSAGAMCYCPATQAAFREWLKAKYDGDLEKLRRAWRRYSLTDWAEIEMPRRVQPFPDTVDMVQFQNDNALRWMRMRRDAIREADPGHFVVAHGNAKTFCDIPACGDDYRAAEFCDIYGYTFWYGNKCNTMLGSDMIRIAAGGKEFWRAEAVGDSDWQGRGGFTEPLLEKEFMADPENIRFDALMSLAAGARGFINPRWRGLQDGGLFDGYGWYNLDGSRSERSDEVKKLARWANGGALLPLWKAQPVRGQVGLLLLEESQIFCYALYGKTDYYSLAYQGAYEAFLHAGVQADPIRLGHIDDYRALYLPFPVALSDATVKRLTEWVRAGGALITEGCPGFFSEAGHAFEHQPSRGLDELLGAKQGKASFGPDMWHRLELSSDGGRLAGGVYRQSYLPTRAKPFAYYDDGLVAGVENAFGAGKVRAIGTMAGYGYKLNPKPEYLRFFAAALPFAGMSPLIRADYNTGLIARLWADAENTFLWCLNERSYPQHVILRPDGAALRFTGAEALRGGDPDIKNGLLHFELPGRDAAIYKLK